MKASIVTIGDEILIGQTIDTNSAWIGSRLTDLGIKIIKIYSVSDTKEEILSGIKSAEKESDLIIITGGLGPTKDDITKVALCEHFNCSTTFNEELHQKVAALFKKFGIPLTKAHMNQFEMPDEAELLSNNVGTAPGMLFKKEKKIYLSTPGVPHEMKWIFKNSFDPVLKGLISSQKIYKQTVRTIGIGESQIADLIENVLEDLHPDISMAYLPSAGQVKLRLMSTSEQDHQDAIDAAFFKIKNILGHRILGDEDASIEKVVMNLCVDKNYSMSTAESCTGGYIAHKLTSISGSSAYYHGSFICYDNNFKSKFLNVKKETLLNYGAVSQETVKEMLQGLFEKTKTDVGIAVSGIAGPGGGTKDKPVGTIWVAYGSNDDIRTKKLQLGKDRLRNIEYTAIKSLDLLRLFLQGQ